MGSLVSNVDLSVKDYKIRGIQAPDFVLPTNTGENWELSKQIGKVILLLFYPQNETLVCTKQLCSIRDNWADYLKTNAVIIGISPGTIDSHQGFADKYSLPMPLLVDENREITKLYGQHKWLPISWTRAMVVIDAKGFIRHRSIMFRGFRPTDYNILSAIYQAKTDASQEKFNEILKNYQERFKAKKWF